MNLKQLSTFRLGGALVLIALLLTTGSALAVPQLTTSHLPLLNPGQPYNAFALQPSACAGGQFARPGAFTKSASNPVFSPGTVGSWDVTAVFSPSVMYYTPDTTTPYWMWYTGTGPEPGYENAIGFAKSADGVIWNRYGSTPVLSKGESGSWDANSVMFPSVIRDGGFKMWYAGSGSGPRQIGLATSTDGFTWIKYGSNPVFLANPGSTWNESRLSNPTVLKVGSTYMMWYSTVLTPLGGIGLATSTDGITWNRYAGNPVISGGSGGWDDTVFAPYVIFDGCWYHMWYSGANTGGEVIYQIGYARSPDGMRWEKLGVVLPNGSGSDFDAGAAYYPTLMMGHPFFRLWYTGGGADGVDRIGFAMAFNFNNTVYLPACKK